MDKCPICATALPDDHPGLMVEKLITAVPWHDLDSTYSHQEGTSFEAAGLEIKVVKRHLEIAYDSYGTAQEGEGYVVIEANGQLYRRDCDIDSYGDITWRVHVRPVEAKPRVVTEFDYV